MGRGTEGKGRGTEGKVDMKDKVEEREEIKELGGKEEIERRVKERRKGRKESL